MGGASIILNGKDHPCPSGATITTLLASLGIDPVLVAVEVNAEIVLKEKFSDQVLRSGDKVEIVRFVGGGRE